MNDNLYALDRLTEAVHELVTHAGRVQERLSEANHYLGRIRLDDVPEGKLRDLFVAIKTDLIFEAGRDTASRSAAYRGRDKIYNLNLSSGISSAAAHTAKKIRTPRKPSANRRPISACWRRYAAFIALYQSATMPLVASSSDATSAKWAEIYSGSRLLNGTSTTIVSTAGATSSFLRREDFFTGTRLVLAFFAWPRVAFDRRALPRVGDFTFGSFPRFCAFAGFLRLAMIAPYFGWCFTTY